jgi:hypothetical protein
VLTTSSGAIFDEVYQNGDLIKSTKRVVSDSVEQGAAAAPTRRGSTESRPAAAAIPDLKDV